MRLILSSRDGQGRQWLDSTMPGYRLQWIELDACLAASCTPRWLTAVTCSGRAQRENSTTAPRRRRNPAKDVPIMLQQFVSHTPLWVWALLIFLVTRGIAAMKPGETSLARLAIVPALFAAWGIWSITQRYGASWTAWAEWLVGIAAGMGLGWMLLRRATLAMNRSTGMLWRSADYSLLPLLLVTFAVKYGFESALSVSPSLSADAGFSAAYLLLSGGFTGIFIGKYCRYLSAARRAAAPGTMDTAG